MFNIRPITYTCGYNLYLISLLSTSKLILQILKLYNSVFQLLFSIFLVVMLERVNFALLGNAQICQPCTTNKSYKIGDNNARVYINLYCLTP